MENRLPVGFYDVLPPSRFDGGDKYFTKDCGEEEDYGGCDFYRKTAIGMNRRLSPSFNIPGGWHEHQCYWGVAIKVLWEVREGRTRRKCEYCTQESPRMDAFDRKMEREMKVGDMKGLGVGTLKYFEDPPWKDEYLRNRIIKAMR